MFRDFLSKVFNNNDPRYFFLRKQQDILRKQQDKYIAEDMCAVTGLSISIRSEHYGECVKARVLQLQDIFQAKLGWQVEGVVRLRFTTSHPSEVNESMIAAMRDHANVSRYLHLPVQSGSSKILRRMKRLYTRERYLEVMARIREAIPEIHFSTDIIVGFPGETEEDFQQTLSLIEEVRYGSLFAFKYSPRPGTPALKIGDSGR